jgi:hypothetical protein
MTNTAEKRGHIIEHLQQALALADEIGDGDTGFLIERALDEARSRQKACRPFGLGSPPTPDAAVSVSFAV